MKLFRLWTLSLVVITPALLSAQTKNPTYILTLPGVDDLHVPYGFVSAKSDSVMLSHINSNGQGVLTRLSVHGASQPTISTYLVPAVVPKPGERLRLNLIGNPSSHYVVAMASGTLGRSADRPPDDQVMSVLDRDTLRLRSVRWLTSDNSLAGFDNFGFFLDNLITLTYAKQGGSTHFRAFHLPELARLADCDRADESSPPHQTPAILSFVLLAQPATRTSSTLSISKAAAHIRSLRRRRIQPHGCRMEQSSSADGQFAVYECPDFNRPTEPGPPDVFYQVWQDTTNHLVAKIRVPGGNARASGMLSSDDASTSSIFTSEPNLLRLYPRLHALFQWSPSDTTAIRPAG